LLIRFVATAPRCVLAATSGGVAAADWLRLFPSTEQNRPV